MCRSANASQGSIHDNADSCAQRLGLGHEVGSQNSTAAGKQLLHCPPHLMARLWVHTRRGLVKHNGGRAAHHRDGERRFAAVAATQSFGGLVGVDVEVEAFGRARSVS